MPPPEAKAALAKLPGKVIVQIGDIRDEAALDQLVRDASIDRIIHGAVVTAGVARERRDPRSILDVNLMGTLSLLQVAQRHPIQRVVLISSVAAYGANSYGSGPLEEADDLARPRQPLRHHQICLRAGRGAG